MARKAAVSLKWHGAQFLHVLDDEIKGIIVRTTRRYQRILQDMMRGPKTGAIYRVAKTPTKGDRKAGRSFRSHQASAPGEPPGIWFGRLRQSIVSEMNRIAVGVWETVVGTSIKPEPGEERSYPQMLEEGTVNMEPRPMWRPALEQVRSEADQLIKGK